MSNAQAGLPRFQDVRAFDAWAAVQPGKWELHDGVPVAMAPERVVHAPLKFQCCLALHAALRAKPAPCKAIIDGPLIPGTGARRFQPDMMVACGQLVRPDDVLVEQPVVLAEVLSPSTQHVDGDLKLESYFALPSVEHYLLISPSARRIIHHSRLEGGRLLTTLHVAGAVELAHPGITITVEDVYDGIELAGETP